MSKEIIEALQQKIAATPQIDVWASPRRLARMAKYATRSAVHQGSQTKKQGLATPQKRAENKHFALLHSLLHTLAETTDTSCDTQILDPFTDPIRYLNRSSPGNELMLWLAHDPLLPTNIIIKDLTEIHNINPSIASQDIRIQEDPIHAWIALRQPIIDRLLEKRTFANLRQRQERIILRLGDIWDHCLLNPNLRTRPHLSRFNHLLHLHTQQIPSSSLHAGHLADVFFRYEILIQFCASLRETTGVGRLLEKQNPALKLFRLIRQRAAKANI